jgi:hypothetical protein
MFPKLSIETMSRENCSALCTKKWQKYPYKNLEKIKKKMYKKQEYIYIFLKKKKKRS